ncbi:Asp-tRNA(Asn)/Glu-tRNA(Gln) amidotransferase subunit GatA [Paenibacillus marinisediminis]
MTPMQLSLAELKQQLQSHSLSALELVNASYTRIAETESKVQAFLTLDEERARQAARATDELLAKGEASGILAGIPVGVKDNIVTEGLRTTCASKFLANFLPIYDATVSRKLKRAGAITVGKLNMDEFAMGGSNENSAYQVTRNPWDLERVPGGSSGGSAAAVAAGQVPFALGSDTGGSIRQPASYCGIVGLKPTYGLVSRYGLVAFASSLDQIGPLTRTVEDSALALQAIAGYDAMDSTSAQVDVPNYSEALTGDIKGLRIGVPKEYMGEGVDPKVKEAILEALRVYESQGATWEEVSMPHTEYAVAAYYLLASSEASSNLARFDGVRYGVRTADPDNLLDLYIRSRSEGFGQEVKRRIMLGTYALSSGYYDAFYLKAQKVRTLIKRDFDEAFQKYDLLMAPTAPTTAFKIGEQVDNPLQMYMNDILTIPVSLAGVPAISVPCGFADGLPVGLQIIGKPFDESTVLRAAHVYEQNTEHHKLRPQL